MGANKQANKITAIGVVQIIGGVLTVLTAGVINLATHIFALLTASDGSLAVFIAGAVAGGLLILRGAFNCALTSRYRKLAKAIGDNSAISLINLERRLFLSRKKLLRTLRRQMKRGLWQTAHIDMSSEMFLPDYEPVIVQAAEPSGNGALDEQLASATAMIRDMTTTAHHIQDEELKVRAEMLAGIAGQIYTYVSKNPDKAGLVRRLSNYFLPTAVGLLQKYVELQNQNVKTESMTEAMGKIKQVTGTLEEVFKNQLDALYSDKTMDIDVEIEVLQNMTGL